jgi:hypothetical protein
MSTSQSPAWALVPAKRDRLRDQIDEWFIEHGVPQFAERYSAQASFYFLVLPLAVLVAFEIGVAPWFPLTAVSLFIALLLVVTPVALALTAWARPFIWMTLSRGEYRQPIWRLVRALLLIAALGVLLLGSGLAPRWSDAWTDFTIILLAEIASLMMFVKSVWSGNAARLARPRAWLIAWTIGAVTVFALLLALEEALDFNSRRLLNELVPGGSYIPLGLPALLCMTIILGLAHRALRAADPGVAQTSTAMAIFYPAVPLLVLVFAGETTVLREVRELGWARVWLPLGCMLLLFGLSTILVSLSRRRAGHDSPGAGLAAWQRLSGRSAFQAFLVLLLVVLLGHPMLPLVRYDDSAAPVDMWGTEAAVIIGLYLLYFALVWSFVSFGLDRIVAWMRREFKRVRDEHGDDLSGVTKGLPMVVIWSAFFALTADTWQLVMNIPTTNFAMLVGLLVGVPLAMVIVKATQQVGQAVKELTTEDEQLTSWEKLRSLAGQRKRRSGDDDTLGPVAQLFEGQPPDDADLSPHLTLHMRINALLIIVVYYALVFVPVAVGAMLLFWVIGRLAVPPDTAADWIFGDAMPSVQLMLLELPLLDTPWIRMAVFIAGFSVLYLAVTLLTDDEKLKQFVAFSAASAAVKQRLAVRVAYRLRLHDSPGSAAGNDQPTQRDGRDGGDGGILGTLDTPNSDPGHHEPSRQSEDAHATGGEASIGQPEQPDAEDQDQNGARAVPEPGSGDVGHRGGYAAGDVKAEDELDGPILVAARGEQLASPKDEQGGGHVAETEGRHGHQEPAQRPDERRPDPAEGIHAGGRGAQPGDDRESDGGAAAERAD